MTFSSNTIRIIYNNIKRLNRCNKNNILRKENQLIQNYDCTSCSFSSYSDKYDMNKKKNKISNDLEHNNKKLRIDIDETNDLSKLNEKYNVIIQENRQEIDDYDYNDENHENHLNEYKMNENDYEKISFEEDADENVENDENDESKDEFDFKKVNKKDKNHRLKNGRYSFIDKIRIRVKGGDGGNGCVSHQEMGPLKKRPHGGHGGSGGNVFIKANQYMQDLNHRTRHFYAENGQNGFPNSRQGRRGKDIIISVPRGTIIKEVNRIQDYNKETDSIETTYTFKNLCDLNTHNSTFLAAKGGAPGLGNRILSGQTTKFGRLRKHMTEGKNMGNPGTSCFLDLELKLIADVGLVGYPNAGKSTVLSVLSRAKPVIAPYPFTTLHPYVGIVEYPDHHKISVADLPGLIDGAHQNIGLGHEFLRHIERTKMLMYVLDTAGTEGRNPLDDLLTLQKELELYSPKLRFSHPSLIIANKMDENNAAKNLTILRNHTDIPIIPISAIHSIDIKDLAIQMRQVLESIK